MSLTAIIDVSSMIWDRVDFDENRHHYYDLQGKMTVLEEFIKKEKPQVLIRSALLEQIYRGFPVSEIPDSFYEFNLLVYRLFSDAGKRLHEYSDMDPVDGSIPELIKPHYNDETKGEMVHLVAKIHSKAFRPQAYFTFEHLHGSQDDLRTISREKEEKHETLFADDPANLEQFFSRFKRIFDHNEKHTRTRAKGKASPLSCYDGEDPGPPQRLLDRAIKHGRKYFSFDALNEVYVVFRYHRHNLWHGFDEENRENIPNQVKKKFNQW